MSDKKLKKTDRQDFMEGFDPYTMRERNNRSYYLAGFLLGIVFLFFVVTLAKLGFWQ